MTRKEANGQPVLCGIFAAGRFRILKASQCSRAQLVEDFARYIYLPRLAGSEVLTQAIRDGLALLTWADRHVRVRRELRRWRGALPGIARWTSHFAVGR